MKELVYLVAIFLGAGAAGVIAYWVCVPGRSNRGIPVAAAVVAALICFVALAILGAPTAGVAGFSWVWVFVTAAVASLLIWFAVCAHAAAKDVMAGIDAPAPPAANRPKPLNNAQRTAPMHAKPAAEQTRAIRRGWKLCEVAFMYEDAEGNVTSRVVTVHWVGDSTFKGECHDRQAERTFRLDRVLGDITDTETGEMLEPEEWAEGYR